MTPPPDSSSIPAASRLVVQVVALWFLGGGVQARGLESPWLRLSSGKSLGGRSGHVGAALLRLPQPLMC